MKTHQNTWGWGSNGPENFLCSQCSKTTWVLSQRGKTHIIRLQDIASEHDMLSKTTDRTQISRGIFQNLHCPWVSWPPQWYQWPPNKRRASEEEIYSTSHGMNSCFIILIHPLFMASKHASWLIGLTTVWKLGITPIRGKRDTEVDRQNLNVLMLAPFIFQVGCDFIQAPPRFGRKSRGVISHGWEINGGWSKFLYLQTANFLRMKQNTSANLARTPRLSFARVSWHVKIIRKKIAKSRKKLSRGLMSEPWRPL